MKNPYRSYFSRTSSAKCFSDVQPEVSFPQLEEACLEFWQEHQVFERSLESSGNDAPFYHFYDGPPFATGLPHYGHLLAGILKDIVPRYWTMQGFRVPRRFGWDCHGLPVECEINKTHGIRSREDVLSMGVAQYNEACRSIVKRYVQEWKKTVKRIGRWVDMDRAYMTMDMSYMQSVWWVFHELFQKNLIYEGHKVVPYSVGISTALSNFEANLNYKMVQDPAITVRFLLEENTYILAWTTTPWTLPSNLALAVNEEIDYVKIQAASQKWILAEVRLTAYFSEYKILERFKGKALVGRNYDPLFPYFESKRAQGAFRIISSEHVTSTAGTGIVHLAPAFGEEDYYACIRAGIAVVNPVNDDGKFTEEVSDFAGEMVRDADPKIIAWLKAKKQLFKQETIDHSYPFCYRSDTPLIYRAVSSWFVSVEKIKSQLIANNAKTHWVPEHLKDGRFGNWLQQARDWAISRNRFWGTPIPIWRNEEGECLCISSQAALEKYSGKKIQDLHRDSLDAIVIASPTGKSPLKRVEEVLDCWFESGSMPYAQWGYPFSPSVNLSNFFPADFIAEGLDQTRAWFYTLLVISTALFDEPPFKNVVVNGLILAEDGKKMSKSLRNYPDPTEILNRHGADALRLYLIDSPVVKAQELKFSEDGVKEIVRKILLRWWNAYAFFVNYANVDGFLPRQDFASSPNILDQWILSKLHSLITNTKIEMENYRLYQVVPRLIEFIEQLTNTYIRFNRNHFWQEGMPEDKRLAYETLYEVLLSFAKIMAPFAPFLTEAIFLNLTSVLPSENLSVHLKRYPEAQPQWIQPELEASVQTLEALVTLGRNQREKLGIKSKIPLKRMRIIHRNTEVLASLKRFEPYFSHELNVQEVIYDSDEDASIQIITKACFPVLGKRLGNKMKDIATAIEKLSREAIHTLEEKKSFTLLGESLTLEDVEIRRKAKLPHIATHPLISMELDPTISAEQLQEGLAREIIRKIQSARKSAQFKLNDRIELQLHSQGALAEAGQAYQEKICLETLTSKCSWVPSPSGEHLEVAEIEGNTLTIGLRVI